MLRITLLASLLLLSACGPQALPVQALDGVDGWPQWPQDQSHGQVSAVDVDSKGRVFVLQRAGREWPTGKFPTDPIPEDTVFIFDGDSGALIDRWGSDVFTMPHGLSIAPDDTVWITDAGREQLLHFDADGTLLDTIGEKGVTGDDDAHFGRPTDVAFDDGDVLASDGYLNARIVRFSNDLGFRSQLGRAGTGDGEFRLPHSVEVEDGRIIVADRENARIQILDRSGSVLGGWSLDGAGFPYAAKWLPDGRIAVIEGRDRDNAGTVILRIHAADGALLASYDLAAGSDGPHRAHDLAIGPDGAIYVADVMGDQLVKLPPGAVENE